MFHTSHDPPQPNPADPTHPKHDHNRGNIFKTQYTVQTTVCCKNNNSKLPQYTVNFCIALSAHTMVPFHVWHSAAGQMLEG